MSARSDASYVANVICAWAERYLDVPEAEREAKLRALVRGEPTFAALVGDAPFLMPVRRIGGYAANVERLHGPGYALLGNAGEFLDPVFSSGVTIALRSAHLAVHTLVKQLNHYANRRYNLPIDHPLPEGIPSPRQQQNGATPTAKAGMISTSRSRSAGPRPSNAFWSRNITFRPRTSSPQVTESRA